ncbi:MAG: asparagine synthase (glutamine-hydrolyzing) [Bryobacteraceae bacterium]
MTEILRHRGPDDEGHYHDGIVGLGHRRLSIIDLPTGRQPITNEDGSHWVVYNGEIFNHADLREHLKSKGHVYRTRSDTESILHAYEEYGPDCVTRFRGMFAFALWDRKSRTLFCARDRLGIKPFYYRWDGSTFLFGSEIKALLEHPEVSAALDDSLLPEYLGFGYTSGDSTLFRGIRRLPPGHHLVLRADGDRPELEIRRYWEPPQPVTVERSEEEWIRECRSRLEETVQLRLMSDVPLGMFLSGGVDSSAIAAIMKRLVTTPVETFAVGYREAAFSELEYARQVAAKIGTHHRDVVVGMEEFFGALPKLVWHEDEPITWPSSVSLYFVAKLAAQHVKVVLTGEGSDELFGGYRRYDLYRANQDWMRRYALVPAGVRAWLRDRIAASRLISGTLRRKLQHTVLGRDGGLEALYLDNFYCAFPAEEQRRVFRREEAASVYAGYLHHWNASEGRSPLGRLLYTDQKTYLQELLMKQDQMSMACSIESRVPFLDHPFVEFSTQVPDRLKIRGGVGKYILKRAVEDLLPHEIIHRKKMGFPTPLRRWLLEPRAKPLYDRLRDRDGLVAAYTERSELDGLLERHQKGAEDATDRIWRLLNLQVWGDLFLTGRADRYRNGNWLEGARTSEPAA